MDKKEKLTIRMYQKANGKMYKAKDISKLADTLIDAFEWLTTEQGDKYWRNVYNNLLAVYEQVEQQESKK